MKIKSDAEYRNCKKGIDKIILIGTNLGNMDLLEQKDKDELIRLSDMVEEWEAAYHPLPGKVSTLITEAIRQKWTKQILIRLKQPKSWGYLNLELVNYYLGKEHLT